MAFDELDEEMARKKDEEGSDLPDPKAPISTRLKGSILTKLDAISQIRREKAREDGRPDAVVKAIDRHYLINLLLPDALDDELKALGADPSDDSHLVELAAKHQIEIDKEKAERSKKPRSAAKSHIDAKQLVADHKRVAGH